MFDDGQVVARDDTLDGRDHDLIGKAYGQRFEELLEKCRGHREDYYVGIAHHLVDIGRGGEKLAVDVAPGEVLRVEAACLERLAYIVVKHQPIYVVVVYGKCLDNGCCPTAIAYYGTLGIARLIHRQKIIDKINKKNVKTLAKCPYLFPIFAKEYRTVWLEKGLMC